ncbi:MAG: phosphoenolpyruvate hydrolase family protein [Desulfobacteraceae bacterium]|nr:phosphoenolpyruvate hydrolase family protein [Desulfobacteraceae bacterium]
MAKKYGRDEVNARLRETLKAGKSIILGGAGDGFTAKLEEKGGLDIIGIYNSGRFRHFGAGSLSGLMPLGRNQDMVMDYAAEVLSMVKETPVIAGFCAQDTRTLWEHWFNTLASMGVSGFMNFPTVGLIDADSRYRNNLEESGLGFDSEAEVLRIAHDLGFFTVGYCFTPDEAKMIAKAGVDIIGCHVGLTSGGLIGAGTVMTLDESVKVTNQLIAAAKEVRPAGDFIAMTHGGPMEDPESTAYVMERTEAVGYLGASSIERTPVEPAVIKVCQEFKNIPVNIPDWLKL